MLKDIWQKINDFTKKKNEISQEKFENKDGTGKALKLVFKPYYFMFDNALSLVLFSALSALVCVLSENAAYYATLYMQLDITKYFILLLCVVGMFAATALFLQKWYNFCFMNEKIFEFNFQPKKILKFVVAEILFLLILSLPLVCFLVLYNRTPNPDWMIELSFFTFFALLATTPFVCTRYLSYFIFIIRGEKLPSFKDVWKNTEDNSRSILVSFLFSIFFLALLFAQFAQTQGIVANFSRYFAFTLYLALILLMAKVQREELFDNK